MKNNNKKVSSESVAMAIVSKLKAEFEKPKPMAEQARLLSRLSQLIKR